MYKVKLRDFSESLINSPASLNEAQRIIDFCLDLMIDFKDNNNYKRFRDFDLRLSMNSFSFLIEENNIQIDQAFWNNSLKELKFDIDNLLRKIE